MDLTPYFSGIISALVAVIGGYVAMKNANERRFSQIERELTETRTLLKTVSDETSVTRDLSRQIAALSTKVDDLRDSVEKHNNVIERVYKLESDSGTAFHRIDELRDELHGIKVGGTA